MLRSMTGIGIVSNTFENSTINIEIKSVNHKYFDIYLRIPNLLSVWEKDIRDMLKSKIKRGKISLSIYFENFGTLFSNVNVDIELATHYYNALKTLSKELRIPSEINLTDFLQMKGVFNLTEKEPDENLKNFILNNLDEAINKLNSMKYLEGKHLEEDIRDRLVILENIIKQIEELREKCIDKFKDKLEEKIGKIFGNEKELVNEKRLEFEITHFTDRVDITEEIVRFKSHLNKFYSTIKEAPPVGKKLDFILQELNREINTISSKNILPEISNLVIEGKTQIEKIREQVQNIE
jgi:uncharacterized protein (TIGR00255 family)